MKPLQKNILLFFIPVLLMQGGIKPAYSQQEITAEEILDRIDRNMFPTTVHYRGRLVIHHQDRIDEKVMLVWGEGRDRGYSEFLSPSRDKGTKYLKLGDELWMYLPNIEKVIKISGHLLRQSMMGSDFSYEDSLERNKLREDYTPGIAGEESIIGRQCYVLELTAKRKDVTYFRQKIWVDKEQYVVLQSERYAKTGKLLKIMTTQKIEQFGERFYPTQLTMEDKLRKNSKTEMLLEEIQFDITIPASTFTRRNLERK
ncbi:outer membrane lipoprotein-sorting protein [candidate division KSB1 bacterium]